MFASFHSGACSDDANMMANIDTARASKFQRPRRGIARQGGRGRAQRRKLRSYVDLKSHFFWRVDTPLQVFPVHTPVRRGQSGALSGGHRVSGPVRRALTLASPPQLALGWPLIRPSNGNAPQTKDVIPVHGWPQTWWRRSLNYRTGHMRRGLAPFART